MYRTEDSVQLRPVISLSANNGAVPVVKCFSGLFNLLAGPAVLRDFFFFFLMIRRPPNSPLFPYPTLFRSHLVAEGWSPATPAGGVEANLLDIGYGGTSDFARAAGSVKGAMLLAYTDLGSTWADLFNEYMRSEEHTSELQSQSNLVCRLLLE